MTPTTDDIKNFSQFAILGIAGTIGLAGNAGLAITGIAIYLAIELHRKHYG